MQLMLRVDEAWGPQTPIIRVCEVCYLDLNCGVQVVLYSDSVGDEIGYIVDVRVSVTNDLLDRDFFARQASILLVHHVSQTYFCIELSELLGNVCWDYSSWATMAVFHSRVRVEVVFQYDAVIPDSSGQFRPLHDILPRTSEIR